MPRLTYSNSLFCATNSQKPKELQCTIVENKENQQFEKLKEVIFLAFLLKKWLELS